MKTVLAYNNEPTIRLSDIELELLNESRDYFSKKLPSGRVIEGVSSEFGDETLADILICFNIRSVHKDEDDNILVVCSDCIVEFYN